MELYIRPVLVLIFAILQFVMPFLTRDQFEEVPSEEKRAAPIYFLPANYAFSIWGLIILLSGVYAIYQLLPDQLNRDIHHQIGGYVLANTVLYSIWLLLAVRAGREGTADYQPWWIGATVLVIIGMLAMNILIFLRLQEMTDQLTTADLWLVVVPTAIYFGWLSVATIANAASFLYGIGWTGERYGQVITVGLLIVAAVITGAVILRYTTLHGAVAYSAVIIWAAIGIAIQNREQSRQVTIAALAVAGVILIVSMVSVNQPSMRSPTETARQPKIELASKINGYQWR